METTDNSLYFKDPPIVTDYPTANLRYVKDPVRGYVLQQLWQVVKTWPGYGVTEEGHEWREVKTFE